jgi:multicomponent Na+:H+ antiporter subunit D
VAFGVKLGLFPFHFWLPAVYAGVRPAVAAILAGALANIGTYGLLRFGTEILAAEVELAATMLIVLGIGSVLYGSMQALSRRTVREVLAYSAIGQIGYVLVAIGLGGPVGIGAAVLFAVVNALNKALLFLSAEIRGWLVGAAFFVGALSVAGVPPAAGFLSKAAVLGAGVETDQVAVVALLVLGAALSFVYLFQIYQHAYWKRLQPVGASAALRAPAIVLGVVVLAGGLWPEPLLAAAGAGAEALTASADAGVLPGSAR